MATATDWVASSALALIAAAVGINIARGTLPEWLRAKFLLTAVPPLVPVVGASETSLGFIEGRAIEGPVFNPNPGSSRRYSDPFPTGRLISGWWDCRTGITCSGPCCRRHKGIDLAGPSGTPVYSIAPGRIIAAGTGSGGCGLRVNIANDDGTRAVYCHLSATMVAAGDRIARGIAVGRVGTTGNATGTTPHLHFEIHIGGQAVDPTRLIGR